VTSPPAELPRIIQVASGREWRGGQRQVLLLARSLRERGLDQIVVTNADGRLASELVKSAVPVRLVRWGTALSPAAFAAIWSETRRRPAILHAHDAHSLTLVGGVATMTRRPFVVTRRVDLPLRHQLFWRRANRVLAVSEAVRQVLLADGIAPARIEVVHSGIDADRVRRAGTRGVRAELGLPARGPLVVNVAALVQPKGHRLLIEAAALLHGRHPDLHWAVAGAGEQHSALLRLARDRGLASVVHFVGEMDEPARLIAEATVFVSCSAGEALGNSILEAMAIGAPVIATRVGGVPELLGEGAGILIDPARADQLAAAVEWLLGDEKARRGVTQEATARLERFTAEGMAARVLQVYRSVVLGH